MITYSREFYTSSREEIFYSARIILSIILEAIPPVNSAIDVGCGDGTWLSVLREKGVGHVMGIDGGWVDQSVLVIPRESYMAADLSRPIHLPSRYDLAMSLEVAEHLPPESAEDFICSLVTLSDFVLFSAAIPYQGGTNHLNEQWPDYWSKLFEDEGYVVLDFVRKRIWNDEKIPFWYRQNALVFADRKRASEVQGHEGIDLNSLPLRLVHPRMYMHGVEHPSVRGSWRNLQKALRRWIRQRVGR